MTTKKIYLLLLTLVLFCRGYSQLFPVQATTQLVPPYSVYLPDYATGINNQLRVLLLNKDVTQPGYKVKLKMTIELNGSIIMRTTDFYNPAPITLEPNQPYSVEGTQLAPYLNSNNIDFIGYSKQEYEQKKGLPEGAYKVCFTAYDYVRPDNVKVSNEACSYYYLSKNDPPFVNMPACGIFIMPNGNTDENLVEKAGRWLSYTLVIPWTADEKNYWYNKVNAELTEKFNGKFDNDEAKYLLLQNGEEYAIERNKEWVEAYGEAWKNVVFAEFTKDAVAKWNKELLMYNKEEFVISVNPDGSLIKETEIDMVTYMNTGIQGNNNINFMWTPRHTSSPNSTLTTKYRLELYAINPRVSEKDNAQLQAMANNAVQTTTPVFTINDLDATQFIYGPAEPSLIDGTQYAWRIQAYDASGRDWFKNNGYSEVCYFTFGGIPEYEDIPQMEQVQSFVANNDGQRRGRANWTQTGAYTEFKVRYRKKGGTGNWFDVNTDSLNTKLYDLEPSTIYEAQVQGKAGQFYGPFSAIDTFKTQAIAPPPGCGLPINAAAGLSTVPLAAATPNMFFKVGTFEFIVDSIGQGSSPGYYSGKGSLSNIPFLNILQVAAQLMGSSMTTSNGGLKVQFNNIFVNNNREVTQGEVHAISRSLEEWTDGWDSYYEERRRCEQEKRNREQYHIDSNAIMLFINYEIKSVFIDMISHTIQIIDANGETHAIILKPDEIGKEVLITSNNGDQFIIRKDGTIEKIIGGGLGGKPMVVLSTEEKNILKLSINKLKEKYKQEKIQEDIINFENKKRILRSISLDKYELIIKTPINDINDNNVNLTYITDSTMNVATTESQIITNYYDAKNVVQAGNLAILFTKATNNDDDYSLFATYLKVENLSFVEYVKSKKELNWSDSQIIEKVFIAIDLLILEIAKLK